MEKDESIVITGAAGFIGSFFAKYLNDNGFENLILVDDFSARIKTGNLIDVRFSRKVHRDQFEDWCRRHPQGADYIFHLGARTDTTERNYPLLEEMNLDYSKWLWEHASTQGIPLIYASSAATYGSGELGYKDDERLIPDLKPLNAYGVSKNEFDIWALKQEAHPPFWAGMKFFNVYGPREAHKGRMASVVFHTFNTIRKEKRARLFKSHHPDYVDGGQLRDFIYVKDVADVLFWLMSHMPASGIYNLGTGLARSFSDLAQAVFQSLGIEPNIEYVDTPQDIRATYQYFTEADMTKLRLAGYAAPFHSLEEGIDDYVRHLLKPKDFNA